MTDRAGAEGTLGQRAVCANCGRPLQYVRTDHHDNEGWVHVHSAGPQCDLYATPVSGVATSAESAPIGPESAIDSETNERQ